MEKELPKALSCRLGEDDTDIRNDLLTHSKDKTERIKKVYRLGLAYEALDEVAVTKEKQEETPTAIPARRLKINTSSIRMKPADSTTVAFYENRIKELEAQLRSSRDSAYRRSVRHIKEPSPLLYIRK